MSEVTERVPVDNSHLDAGIAAREARAAAAKEPSKDEAATATPTAGENEGGQPQGQTQNDPESSADSDQDDAAEGKPRKKPGVHQRIDELTKARRDAERERDHWREQAMRQQPAQPQSQPAQAAPQETGEPTLESCDFDVTEFTRRHYAWQRDQEKKQEQAQQRQSALAEREAAFRADHPDYDQVVRNPQLPISQAMAEEIMEAENAPAIVYYLGQNPQEAADIAQMSERAMSRAIGRIEARLSAQPASSPQPSQPTPKTVTRAPAPVTTLTGAPAVTKSYEGMSQREYEEARRKEREAKGLPNR